MAVDCLSSVSSCFFAYECMAKVTAEETETCFMSDRGSPCFILIVLTI